MTRGALWRISVATSAEAEDAVAELLTRLSGQPAAAYTDIQTGVTTVSVYASGKPVLSMARHTELPIGLLRIASCGLDLGPARISARPLRPQDWAESWKRHF